MSANTNVNAGFAMSGRELDAAMRYLKKSIASGLTTIQRSFPRSTSYADYEPKKDPKLSRWANYQRRRRAKFLKAGLTTEGKKRVNRSKYADMP